MNPLPPAQECDPKGLPLDGLCLIEASAGTGKTYTITALVLRLLVEKAIPIDALLVVTFTKAATAELKERICARIRCVERFYQGAPIEDPLVQELAQQWARSPGVEKAQARISRALQDMDRACIFTIHGWCQRVLQEQAMARGDLRPEEVLPDLGDWIEAYVHDYWSRELYALGPTLADSLYRDAGKCGPEYLLKVAQEVLRDPQVEPAKVVDWEGCEKTYQGLVQRWQQCWEHAKLQWTGKKEEVEAYYREIHPRLKKTSYRDEVYRRRLDALWTWLQSHPARALQCSEELLKAFQYLSEVGLHAKGLKKNQSIAPSLYTQVLNPFGDLWEELERAGSDLSCAFVARFVEQLRFEFRKDCDDNRPCTFDELLTRTRDLLRDPEQGPQAVSSIQNRFQVALIDEFQDTDPAQYEVLSTVWGNHSGTLFLVGDPKQAIYRFRGADIHAYLRARSDAGPRRYRLTHNYRSHCEVIAAVNALFSQVDRPFVLSGLDFDPVQVGREVTQVEQESLRCAGMFFWQQAQEDDKRDGWALDALCARIREYLEQARWPDRAVLPGDLAVLCGTNRQAMEVRARLEQEGIAVVLRSGQSVWASPEAQSLIIALDAIAHCGRPQRLRAALLSELFDVSINELEALFEDDQRWELWSERFRSWRSLWQERGFMTMWRDLLRQIGLHERVVRRPGAARSLTNWEHLAQLIYVMEREQRWAPGQLVQHLLQGDPASKHASEIDELQLADEGGQVQVLTIHRSKGLEFPVVFCPYLGSGSEKKCPPAWIENHQGQRRLVLQGLNSGESEAQFLEEAQGEARRQLYVALTRARSHCEIFWPLKAKDNTALAGLLAGHDPGSGDALAGLRKLSSEPSSGIEYAVLKLPEGPQAPLDRAPTAQGPSFERPLDPSHFERTSGPRISSYTSMARNLRRDEAMRGGEEERPGFDENSNEQDDLAQSQLAFSALQPGAQSGVFLHDALQRVLAYGIERSDFETTLSHFLDGSPSLEEREQIEADLLAVLHRPIGLSHTKLALSGILAHRRRVEVEFLIRCGSFRGSRALGGGRELLPFRCRELAQLILQHSQDPDLVRYAKRLQQRSFDDLHGFVNGFIDLCFESGGRYFVLDYKSNLLSGRRESFESKNLWPQAIEHDYPLQALLYLVAMHRRLEQRLANYLIEEQLGDAILLFLRGFDDEGRGVMTVKMEAPLILALDHAMQRGFGGSDAAREGAAQ